MHQIMLDRERERLLRYRPASPNSLSDFYGESEEGGFLPVGAGPTVDHELLAYAEEHNEAREVESVGMVIFTAVRPLGTFQVSERSLGFFGTVTEKTGEAVREVFEQALEAGAFE